MREKILGILGHLSQSLNDEKDLFYDAQEIWAELTGRGYSENEIENAVSHIERMSLDVPGPYWSDEMPVYRTYCGKSPCASRPRCAVTCGC